MELFDQLLAATVMLFWTPLIAFLATKTMIIGEVFRTNFVVAIFAVGTAAALGAWLAPEMPMAELVEKGLAATGLGAIAVSGVKAVKNGGGK